MLKTGIIIAGFGTEEYFPRFIQYECYGFILDSFIYERINDVEISYHNSAHIQPFATSSMAETFLRGYSSDVWIKIRSEHISSLYNFVDTIKSEIGSHYIPNLKTHIENELKKFLDNLTLYTQQTHFYPLYQVIGSLPLDEMAELAETMIMLESLKERVTLPTQSVGGPIDVAVISKGDGFIWIKRKHYFEPELNPRFFKRFEL